MLSLFRRAIFQFFLLVPEWKRLLMHVLSHEIVGGGGGFGVLSLLSLGHENNDRSRVTTFSMDEGSLSSNRVPSGPHCPLIRLISLQKSYLTDLIFSPVTGLFGMD